MAKIIFTDIPNGDLDMPPQGIVARSASSQQKIPAWPPEGAFPDTVSRSILPVSGVVPSVCWIAFWGTTAGRIRAEKYSGGHDGVVQGVV